MTDGDVSRETSAAPPPPPGAADVFGPGLSVAVQFAELLASDGVARGLIGPRETPRIWDRHLLNCALVGRAIPAGSDVCDIGSGAGLPGVVLAIARPDLTLTLVEPLARRTAFLQEVAETLALPHVEVVRARAEELHGQREFAVVTARAVAPLERLVAWAMPLVRQEGALVAMKGSSAHDEIAAAQKALGRHGAGRVSVEQYSLGKSGPQTTVVRVEATQPSSLRLPPPRRPNRRKRR